MKTFIRIVGCPVGNLGIVKAGPIIYRSAQPDLEGYRWLKTKFGLQSSLNLKLHSDRDIVEAAGIRFIDRPIDTIKAGLLKELSPERINEILNVVEDPANSPILLHCRQGHDRTGTIVACYRIRFDGWTFNEAFDECVAYGFNPLWHELRESIEKYAEFIKAGKP